MATKTVYTNKDAVMGKQVVGGSFSGWNGKDDHIQVGRTTNYKWRGLLYFPISFSGMTAINSATLHLVTYAGTGGGVHQPQLSPPSTLMVRRMTSDWGEGSSNPGEGNLTGSETWEWDNRATNYTTSGGVEKSLNQGGSGSEETINITDIVRSWFNGSNNYGLILINDNETSTSKALLFYARESGSGNRAYVEIDYSTNEPPNAPVNLSPTGGVVVNSMTPTLSFTRSDPDSGDYISGYRIHVYESDGVTHILDSGSIWIEGSTPTSTSYVYGTYSVDPVVPLVEGQTYWWKVRTRDKAEEWGPYSALQSFIPNAPPSAPTVVVLSSPVGDINDSTPSFGITHNDLGNPQMYGYQFIINSGSPTGPVAFDSGAIDISGDPQPNVTVTSGTLAFGTNYWVKARTQDDQGVWGPYSPQASFALHAALAPQNLSPSGNEQTNVTPYLSATNASSYDIITAYWIRVYTDDESSTPLPATRYTTGIESGGTGFSQLYAGSALASSTYYKWQAYIETESGAVSGWSSMARFFVQDPSVPSLTAPATSGQTLTPTFTGQRAAAFDRFQYQLYASNGTTLLYDSGTLSSTISGSGPYVFSSVYGGSPALTYGGTQYKWRARVSADGGSNWSSWSGLVSFTTASAGVAVLNSPAANAWITDSTPDFTIDRSGSDTIDEMQVIVYNASQVQIWDSGMTNVSNGTTNVGPITYAGPTLTGGDYYWSSRYKSAAGPTGPYSALRKFRLNQAPSIPSDLYPTSNFTFGDTLLPTFRASFQDPDKSTNNDYPTEWDIDILDEGGSVLATKNITSSLSSGLNAYTWTGGDYALSYGVQYMWRTRFKDSKGVWGSYTASSNFKMGNAPNGTISTPSDGSTVTATNPTVEWSYSGNPQALYRLTVVDSVGTIVYDTTPPVVGDATSAQVANIKNNRTYTITLTVWDEDGLVDPSPSTVTVTSVFDAPDPIAGLSITTDESDSYVQLDWEQGGLKTNHTFRRYQIYRRVIGDVSWYEIGSVVSRSTPQYVDWEAGHGIHYEYRVTQIDTRTGAGIELESPDGDENIVPARLDADVWMFIGYDRADDHIVELPVSDEGHNRPVQQEEFEPLGSDRKVIMRGFVLGHEGSISMTWINREVPSPADSQVSYNETIIGRRIVDYLTRNRGPHILKSPFGDVWEVEFQSPTYKWLDSGNLTVDLSWIEIGQTSQVAV